MKTVFLFGSPRKRSNGSIIAERFCTTATNMGAEVKTFSLNDLDYRGCQGCMACKKKLDRCGLKDDLTELLEAVMPLQRFEPRTYGLEVELQKTRVIINKKR